MPILKSTQSLDHQIRPDRCQFRPQCFGSVFRSNRDFALQEYVAGIKPCIDTHGRNSGDGFATGNRPLDRRCSAILGQERCMQVQISESRKIDHPLRNDAAIAHDNDGVRVDRRQLIAEFGVILDGSGLHDGNPQVRRRIFHRRNCNFHPASARPIGLRYRQHHGMPRIDQSLQGRDSESRRATENQKHSDQVSGFRTSSDSTCFSRDLTPETCPSTIPPPSPAF